MGDCSLVMVQGHTALIWAAIRNKVSVVEAVLKAGADANATTNDVCMCAVCCAVCLSI
jgi:ankyrin repeat protein